MKASLDNLDFSLQGFQVDVLDDVKEVYTDISLTSCVSGDRIGLTFQAPISSYICIYKLTYCVEIQDP